MYYVVDTRYESSSKWNFPLYQTPEVLSHLEISQSLRISTRRDAILPVNIYWLCTAVQNKEQQTMWRRHKGKRTVQEQFSPISPSKWNEPHSKQLNIVTDKRKNWIVAVTSLVARSKTLSFRNIKLLDLNYPIISEAHRDKNKSSRDLG